MQERLTAIDLFAGAGGLSEGFRQAGFSILAANDFDLFSEQTFRRSNPETAFVSGAIEGIQAEDFLTAAELEVGQLDVLLGGPPCQAFSVYNPQRGMHDDRSGLFRQYLRLVEGLQPHFVVIENVTGILSVAGGHAVEEIRQSLELLGYHVEHRIMKAEEYGVPQKRRRVLFVGSRDHREIDWPAPTHGTSLLGPLFSNDRMNVVTVDHAISDLPPLGISEGVEETHYTTGPLSEYQTLMRQGSVGVFNHVSPDLQEINIKRLSYIPQGGSWRDIPHELLPPGMKRAKRSNHTKRYGRLHPEGLASTILTKCDIHWGAYIHPWQERTITVREAARLQSFPDRTKFLGPRGQQYKQVGNAVPPALARAIAVSIKQMALGTAEDKEKVPSDLSTNAGQQEIRGAGQ
jgi:DNA (cytosine-5)-methyltransferase 1